MERILSIAPGTIRFGFCYLEGSDLLDWGLRRKSDSRGGRGVKDGDAVARLVNEHRPSIVVLTLIPASDQRRPKQRRFVEATQSRLARGSAQVALCSDAEVRKCFKELTLERDLTKQHIMARLGLLFPELSPLVPKPRKAWQPQNYWTAMFTAAAQAVTWIAKTP